MVSGGFGKAFLLGAVLFALALAAPAPSLAEPASVGLVVDTSGGYARLIFAMPELSEEVDASAQIAGNVLIVNFTKPIRIAIESIAMQAPGYFSAARRDPDSKAIRFALARKVKLNSMAAAEKFFIDLLPDTWSGAPPALPQEVIEELARRARAAERLERLARLAAQPKKLPPVRVRVAHQPTFMRYVFDVPEHTSVAADRAADRLTLTFDAPITFDIADAVAALPAAITAINSEVQDHSALVRFSFPAKVDVRTFRDDNSYVVDIVTADAEPAEKGAGEGAAPVIALDAGQTDKPPPDARVLIATPESKSAAPSAAASPQAPPATAAPSASETKAAPARQAAPQQESAEAASPRPPAATPEKTAKVDPPGDTPKAPAAPSAPTAESRASAAPRAAREGKTADEVPVELSRQGASLKLSFPFRTPAAMAVFHRADTLWFVFDTTVPIDLSALEGEASRTIRRADFFRTSDADVVRIRLDRPHLSSVATEGPAWSVTVGDSVLEPTHALDLMRNMIGPNRSSVTIPFEQPHRLHRIRDPEVGDNILVVTAFAPARGVLKEQDFIEFRALASTQGVVVEPIADDLSVELAADKVMVSRPGGLTLSNSLQSVLHGSGLRPLMFDSQLWGFDRQATYSERQASLIAAAAASPPNKRLAPRLELARFYIARDMYAEAKSVLDVALADNRPTAEVASASVLRAVAELMMNRPEDALKDLAGSAVGDQHDAPLWRAIAYSRQGNWAQANGGFKRAEAAIATLPIELQRIALKDEMRAAIEVSDFAGAGNQLNDFETIGVPRDMRPALSVLIGRLSEGLGHTEDALAAYRAAADSWDRPAAAQGRLRETLLRHAIGDLKRDDVVSELETLTAVWRGDETEVEALQVLARLYTEEGRYRDSFYVMRSAMAARPDSEMTRRIQEGAAATFEALFLAGKGDALPAVDALALFYDFRELTPIGRRGDEMIRRLADRLASVDLLDQAADLLQYQVDHRLQGAARAQVATRLAVIYLMNRKSDRALAILRATRTADVSNELRNPRLLLEARALSDLGRHDLALEVAANLEGREAIRLRSDILWAGRRWRESGEQIEILYGDRFTQWQPLSDVERTDILRAAIGYALGEDALGLARFREKYAAKMAATPDARAFEIVSAPLGASGAEFRDIAHAAASVDTLEGFLREMLIHYPDASTAPAPAAAVEGPAANAPPAVEAPSAPPAPPSRASGRSAQR